jgi:hypothetical protein
MKINKTEARKIAHEFAALVLDRQRRDLLPYLREAYGATEAGQPASVSNTRSAIECLLNDLWKKSFKFPPSRAKENAPQLERAVAVFNSLFPAERSADERARMAIDLARYLARADCVGEARTKTIAQLAALDEGAR